MKSERKYKILYEELKSKISLGIYSSGQKLPTESELATFFSLSRQTVRQALKTLENEGIITKTQGSGSYVSEKYISIPRKMRIAVITTYISEYIFPSILRGIESVASANSYSLVLNATNNSMAGERKILNNLLANPVDGILVEGTKTALPNPNISFYKALASTNVPIVFFNGIYPDLKNENIIYVVMDDYSGGAHITTQLVEAGHTAIGGIFKNDDIQGLKRFSGYVDTLVQRDIYADDSNVVWFNTETKGSFLNSLSENLHRILHSCTALVCYNDEIAAMMMPIIKNTNSTITAVVSFDNILNPGENSIGFSSLPHPKEELGRIAAVKLFDLIGGKPESSVVLPWLK